MKDRIFCIIICSELIFNLCGKRRNRLDSVMPLLGYILLLLACRLRQNDDGSKEGRVRFNDGHAMYGQHALLVKWFEDLFGSQVSKHLLAFTR